MSSSSHPCHLLLTTRFSRRTVLRRMSALPMFLAAGGVPQRGAMELPSVRVAAPTIERQKGCTALASAAVVLSRLAPGRFYELSGEILEVDEPDGDPDLCCPFEPLTFAAGPDPSRTVLLATRGMISRLGLLTGMGPAQDETFSPDLVELMARVWLRDLATGAEHGPWESPARVVVAKATFAWTPDDDAPANLLQMPRGTLAERPGATNVQPPRACIP